ncbi:hypothetical protein M011DRAFT_485871 [Sporormia fimetaria CBS 119925]|uniref:PWWP domain-containing protein n=1 Tax=Sporormia fimetaria CBS 119925 TaxID=1340428 RepID=A0A6A6VBI9_9PLEO|nr:hypothetical protein M011DRAFT_485871 [Sporormia fimetaria CBS 119925]
MPDADGYCLYQKGPIRPPWPAFMCTEGMLPKKVREGRPSMNAVAVYLLQKRKIEWASFAQLLPIGNMQCPEELARKHPGLRQAYAELINAFADKLCASVWKVDINAAYGVKDDPSANADAAEEALDRPQAKVAARNSVGQHQAMKAQIDKESRRAQRTRLKQRKAAQGPPSQESCVSVRSSQSEATRDDLSVSSQTVTEAGVTHEDEIMVDEGMAEAELDGVAAQPAADEIEDPRLDDDTVRLTVGPDCRRFYIPRTSIDEAHFKGRGQLTPFPRTGWRLDIPRLKHIKPDEFEAAAHFLAPGNFNCYDSRLPTNATPDQRTAALMKVLAEAWSIAVLLSLDTGAMMAAIVRELAAIPSWTALQTLLLADTVYKEPAFADNAAYEEEEEPEADLMVTADTAMRHLVATRIAHNFTTYGNRPNYIITLLETLQRHPDLNDEVIEYLHEHKTAISDGDASDEGALQNALVSTAS